MTLLKKIKSFTITKNVHQIMFINMTIQINNISPK